MARMQAAGFDGLPYLRQHDAAAVVRGQCHAVDIHVDRFFFRADVALSIGVGAAHDGDIDLEGFVAQDVLAVDVHQFDQRFLAAGVAATGILTRIGESADAGMGKQARPSRPDFPQEVLDDTTGEAIGLDLFILDELLHLRRPGEVRGDHLAHHAFVGEAVGAQQVAVTEAKRMHQREITRMTGLEKAFFDGFKNGFGRNHAGPIAADGDGVAVLDECGCGCRVDELGFGHERLLG